MLGKDPDLPGSAHGPREQMGDRVGLNHVLLARTEHLQVWCPGPSPRRKEITTDRASSVTSRTPCGQASGSISTQTPGPCNKSCSQVHQPAIRVIGNNAFAHLFKYWVYANVLQCQTRGPPTFYKALASISPRHLAVASL